MQKFFGSFETPRCRVNECFLKTSPLLFIFEV